MNKEREQDDGAIGRSVPYMRSMLIMPHSSRTVTRSSTEPAPMNRFCDMKPPAWGNLDGKKPVIEAACNHVRTKSDDFAEAPSVALLEEAEILDLPLYSNITIGRNAIKVNQSLEGTQRRIIDFLRHNSIAFSVIKEDAAFDCRTESLVHFTVCFWKESDAASSDEPESYVVEVQRRRGCGMAFQCVRKGVFQVIVTGEVPNHSVCPYQRAPRAISGRIKRMFDEQQQSKCQGDASTRFCPKRICKESLTRCEALLESRHVDRNCLGVEGLVRMTDTSSSEGTTCETVACALVFGEGTDGPQLQTDVLHLLEKSEPRVYFSSEENDKAAEMRVLVLRLLANALGVVVEKKVPVLDSSSRFSLGLQSSGFWNTVLCTLQKSLVEADEYPQEATLSLRCMNLLLKLSPDTSAKEFVGGLALVPSVLHAQAFGKEHHMGLEQESKYLIKRLT